MMQICFFLLLNKKTEIQADYFSFTEVLGAGK